MLYTPVRALPWVTQRPIDITRIGFGPLGPYLGYGGPPPSLAVLSSPRVGKSGRSTT